VHRWKIWCAGVQGQPEMIFSFPSSRQKARDRKACTSNCSDCRECIHASWLRCCPHCAIQASRSARTARPPHNTFSNLKRIPRKPNLTRRIQLRVIPTGTYVSSFRHPMRSKNPTVDQAISPGGKRVLTEVVVGSADELKIVSENPFAIFPNNLPRLISLLTRTHHTIGKNQNARN